MALISKASYQKSIKDSKRSSSQRIKYQKECKITNLRLSLTGDYSITIQK